jgi:hypothetical protein
VVGLAALGIWPVVVSLMPTSSLERPTLLGVEVPWLLAAMVVYVTAGAWLVRMVLPNLKREIEDMQLLSRRDAVVLALYVNVMFVVFLDPQPPPGVTPAAIAVMLDVAMLYLVGLLTLAPRDRLVSWWRAHRLVPRWAVLADDGLPWPWIVVVAAVDYVTLVAAGEAGLLGSQTFAASDLAGRLAIGAVFAVRDVMFLQWCRTTSMRRPIVGGAFFLYLLHFALLALRAAPIWPDPASPREWLLLPMTLLLADLDPAGGAAIWTALQVPVIAVLVLDIRRRLERPPRVPASG